MLEPWAATQPYDPEIWLALGYAALRSGDRFETLRAYGQALRLQPKNREAADAMAGVLLELGAPFAAGALLPETPLGIQVRQAGALVRWGGHVVPRDPRRRFEGTDAALKRLEALLRKARSARKPDAGLIVRLRRDRVVALRQRERWADAVAETQELRADGDQIPPYVREAEADSLLALRRPREARLGYEDVLRVDPERREAHIGRFFALVEEENFRAAFAEIDALAASEPPGLRQPEQRVTRPNWNWLEGHVLAAEARSFADMPGAAWKRLLPLAEGAPANAELRRVLGDIAAGRGWPRRGDEEIHIAASLAPEDKGVQLALAESAMRRSAMARSAAAHRRTRGALSRRRCGATRGARSRGLRLMGVAHRVSLSLRGAARRKRRPAAPRPERALISSRGFIRRRSRSAGASLRAGSITRPT